MSAKNDLHSPFGLAANTKTLPYNFPMHPIAKKIATLQRQLALRQYATAACWTAATLLAAAIALGFADYWVRFRDPGLRVMATATLVAVAIWCLYRWWYKPGRHQLAPLAVARKVESHFPQLNDSLASALEFLHQSEHDQTAGSAQLRRLVVAEAETTVAGLPLQEVINRRPLRGALIGLTTACIALVACLAWDAGAVGTALARLVNPLGATQWPRQHHLEFRNPPTRLAAGQTFEAELTDSAGALPEEVRIDYRIATGSQRETASEPMAMVGDVMIARRENVRQSFAFRATGGDDDLMKWHWVEVVEPPRLKTLAITVYPPTYTGLPPTVAERHLDVLAGTGIELRGTATEPLRAARVLQDSVPPIDATISAGDDGKSNVFHIAPEKWIATKTGPYSLELSDGDGLAGVVGQWNLRVEPDSPPSVSWQSPSEDLYVTPNAIVPIALVVKDNLAIQRVDLTYERSDWSEAERERLAAAAKIELYRGAEKPIPPPASSTEATKRGESRILEYAWNLEPLNLPVGAEISIIGEAADYRPGVGHTVAPRRISIVTPDELDARLAERQAQIARQLERVLTVERTTREDVRRLEIQQQQAGSLVRGDRNTLQSAELNQRRAGRILIDPVEGVPALIESLLNDLEMNRVTRPDLRAAIDRVTSELDRMATGPLNVADRELTTSRKTIAETTQPTGDAANDQLPLNEDQAAALTQSLAATGVAQDDVIATLERLVSELSGKADYRRFARLIAELREDQLAHEQASRREIGVETIPLSLNDLTRAQRASLNKAAAGQNAIAARFQKIEQSMDSLAQEMTQAATDGADILAGAVELARSLAIAAKMEETSRDFAENRVGGALDREMQIAADLEQVLNILRGTTEQRPEQLVDKLMEAEERLDQLRQQLAELRQQIADAENQPANAAKPEEIQTLHEKQQELRSEINQLAKQLEKLQAADASQSTQSAASRLDNKPPNDKPPSQDPQQPSSSNQVQKAEQDLEQAAQQLAERRQQAEDDLALEIVRRFQTQLTEMVERQKKVIAETVVLDGSREPDKPLPEVGIERASKLAGEERELAEMAKEHSELLFGLGSVRVSLEEAERRLTATAELLDQRDTGPRTQQAERLALARLEGMMEAFAQTATEAQPNEQPPPNPGAGPAGDQPQRRPTFELLEVKMLRMLQVDLQNRTREYQQRLAELDTPLDQNVRAELEQEAQQLAAEQGRLAELVENMLTRDNKQGEQ